MAKKSPGAGITSFQQVEAEVITDPAEIAAFDERRRQYRDEVIRRVLYEGLQGPPAGMVHSMLSLSRELSIQERRFLLTQLADELSSEEGLDWLREVVTRLSSEPPPSPKQARRVRSRK
jgi:hypothetical protein